MQSTRRIPFTKMQGAGNDFVVLDETRGRLGLTSEQYRFLGDRHFGVGADQILTVRPSPAPGTWKRRCLIWPLYRLIPLV